MDPAYLTYPKPKPCWMYRPNRWTPSKKEIVRNWWGLIPAKEIAARLGPDFNKDMVIGVAHRMNCPKLASPLQRMKDEIISKMPPDPPLEPVPPPVKRVLKKSHVPWRPPVQRIVCLYCDKLMVGDTGLCYAHSPSGESYGTSATA